MNSVNQIILQPHQIKHAEKLKHIININSGYIDGSPTGSGKTFVTMFLAKYLKLPLYIICPSDVIANWTNVCSSYKIPVIDIITYQSFTSKKGNQPKHGLLERYDTVIGKDEITKFRPTDKLMAMIDSGVFFISGL